VLFSFLVGFGAVGLIARPIAGGLLLSALAVAGGIAFEAFAVRPLWNFLFRFASAPAVMLDSVLLDEARAASSFDGNGQGLVTVELDGQIVQILGTLRAEDRDAGIRVRGGDRLRVEAVDGARNRCTVSYLGR
jgi:translation initiation factor IF-1